MSNPLLRPNDPRFRRPEVRDEEGKNRFSEDDATAAKQNADAPRDVFAATAAGDERPYLPRYDVQQQGRTTVLLILAGLGWLAAVLGSLELVNLLSIGWIAPLLGLVPAATAWLLAYEDLKGIRAGAIDPEARPHTRLALWLGLAGLLLCGSIIAWMIYLQMDFLPDL